MPANTHIKARPELTALELERNVPVLEAAQLMGVSEATFKRRYRHLIRKLSPRRQGVKLRDLLSDSDAA